MAASIAYVTLGSVQGHPGSMDAPEEGVVYTGVWINACYVIVSPSNKTGVSGSVLVPFNYADDYQGIIEAVQSLVTSAVKKKTGVAPRVRIIGQEEVST
jgi:hypothetical protein